jgi:hypothetical protein
MDSISTISALTAVTLRYIRAFRSERSQLICNVNILVMASSKYAGISWSITSIVCKGHRCIGESILIKVAVDTSSQIDDGY